MDPVQRILGDISHLTSGGILDIETFSLERGSPIHEVAYAVPSEKRATQYILQPTYAGVMPAKAQDVLGLAVSKKDILKRLPVQEALGRDVTWGDIVRVHALMRQGSLKGPVDAQELRNLLGSGPGAKASEVLSWSLPGGPKVKEVLAEKDSWLLRQIEAKTYPWMEGADAPSGTFKIKGYTDIESTITNMKDLFGRGSPHPLLGDIKKRITWVHNASYESARIGAWLRISESEGRTTGLKDTVRWHTTAGLEDLYVTGPEVNAARAKASITGDWAPVWQAYMKHSGPGDVRDIMDVLRANQSYARQLGLIKTGRVGQFSGLSVDVATKLFLISEGRMDKVMGHKETHVALLDAAREEGYLVKRATMQAATLSEVAKGTETGKELLKMAKGKQGPLYDAIRFFAAWDFFNSSNQEANFTQRLGRAFEDFATQGRTVQHSGSRLISSEMVSNAGERAIGTLNVPAKRTILNSPDEFLDWLKKTGQYSEVDFDKVSGEMIDELTSSGGLRVTSKGTEIADRAALLTGARAYTDQIVDRTITRKLAEIANGPSGVAGFMGGLTDEIPSGVRQSVASRAFSEGAFKRGAYITAGIAASIGILGAAIGSFQGPGRQKPSLRTVTYERWLENQREFSGLENAADQTGMREGGIAASMRRAFTDFGSPYCGPWISNQVFFDQDILQERERFNRERFSYIHSDPKDGVFAQLRRLVPSLRTSSLLHSGVERADSSEYSGIQGDGLFKVNLKSGGWRMRVDDADTVTIERGLLFRDKYSFRLSGIDAPEVRHGQQKGQPGSEEAKEKLQSFLNSGQNIEMVFNPRDVTYGRSLGVVMIDGRNINAELVKSGSVAALNWQSKETQMLRGSVMAAYEKSAQGGQAGMWQHPFWQVYQDTLEGQRITFNQMNNLSHVAESAIMMSAVSLMRNAEAQGFYSNSMQIAAADIKEHIRAGGLDRDYKFPIVSSSANAPHNNYMLEMQIDLGSWIQTKGGKAQNKFKHKEGLRKLNKGLTLDTMSTSTSVWNRRRLEAFDQYESQGNRRRQQMAEAQKGLCDDMFCSPIGHCRW